MTKRQTGSIRAPDALVELRLDAMTYGGDAIGRAQGKAVFVRGGIAGERVRARITEDRGRYARACVTDVIERSPHRIEPRCKHFGFDAASCGGCHWQHIDYAAQLRFKTQIVREQLARIGRIDAAHTPVRDTLASPSAWTYRNHAQFGIDASGRPGFQAARSKRVVPIDECHIIRAPIAAWLRENQTVAGGARIDVRAFQPDRADAWGGSDISSPSSICNVRGVAFRVSPGSFFQVNTSLIGALVDAAMNGLDLRGGETILDAYCGVGLFSRFAAPAAGRVIGIESSPDAMADARHNLAGFRNVDLHEGAVETVLPQIEDAIDAAIVDPPRAGCGAAVIDALIDRRVQRLVYVSCDPSTLARDARRLIDGGYTLAEVQPLDMFPQTYHIECVARFGRAGDAPTSGSGYTYGEDLPRLSDLAGLS